MAESTLTELDYRRIAAESFADVRTVRKAYDCRLRPGMVHARIAKAALALGLPLPPEPPRKHEGA